MDTANKILEEMESKDGKIKKDGWINKYIEKQKIKSEKIRLILSNTQYMEWIIKFTQDKEEFYDDDFLYHPEKYNDYDRNLVLNLHLFYEGIEKYANENHIYPTEFDFGISYKIRLNNYGFEIGILVGQGNIFFCKKCRVENEQDFIDFNDIMINKKQNNVDQINELLKSLSNMVLNTYEQGVPIEAIVNTLDDVINKINSKPKTLTKKTN